MGKDGNGESANSTNIFHKSTYLIEINIRRKKITRSPKIALYSNLVSVLF